MLRMANLTRLAPHEAPDQDVILLGHSMGGILTAEVCLLQSQDIGSISRRKHRVSLTSNVCVKTIDLDDRTKFPDLRDSKPRCSISWYAPICGGKRHWKPLQT